MIVLDTAVVKSISKYPGSFSESQCQTLRLIKLLLELWIVSLQI